MMHGRRRNSYPNVSNATCKQLKFRNHLLRMLNILDLGMVNSGSKGKIRIVRVRLDVNDSPMLE